MRVEKGSSIVLILLICYSSNILAQLSLGKQNMVDTLFSKRVIIDLPDRYRKNVTNYDEGMFIDYLFQDGASLTIFQGRLQKVPLLSREEGYFPEQIDTINDRIIYRGTMNGEAWREDQFKGIRIYYNKVPLNKIVLYNSILDSTKVLYYPE